MTWATADAARLFEIMGVNILLTGDNAVAVGMAIRDRPAAQRKVASAAGIGIAALLQTAATLTVARLLTLPMVSLAGGFLLCAIAVRLLRDHGDFSQPVAPAHSDRGLLHAIVTVAGAYLLMCLDNIVAVAAAGRGHPLLLIAAVLLSTLVIIPASLVIARLMERSPLILTVGAGILGWIAGSMLAAAAMRMGRMPAGRIMEFLIPAAMTAIVVTSPWWWRVQGAMSSRTEP